MHPNCRHVKSTILKTIRIVVGNIERRKYKITVTTGTNAKHS
jgi:hypothetical protein